MNERENGGVEATIHTGLNMETVIQLLDSASINSKLVQFPIDLSVPLLVVSDDEVDQPIVFCSKAFQEMTGYEYQEIVGKNCRFLQGKPHFS